MTSRSSPSLTPDTSASLLLRVRNPEDKESWATFERIYGDIIRSYCRYSNLQACDVDDVTQDVLTQVSLSIRSFEYDPAKGRFRSWLGTITANRIRKLLRKTGTLREVPLTVDLDEPLPPGKCQDPDSTWIELFSEGVLAEACKIIRVEFEETTWKCFEQTWFGQQAPSEVAEAVGVSLRAVYINKSRVLKRLEQQIRILADDLTFDMNNP